MYKNTGFGAFSVQKRLEVFPFRGFVSQKEFAPLPTLNTTEIKKLKEYFI